MKVVALIEYWQHRFLHKCVLNTHPLMAQHELSSLPAKMIEGLPAAAKPRVKRRWLAVAAPGVSCGGAYPIETLS